MIDYNKEVSEIVSGIRDVSDVQIINKLYYSKYAFCVTSNFNRFNRDLSAQIRSGFTSSGNMIAFTKASVTMLKNIYGDKWENYEKLYLGNNFTPYQYDDFIKYIQVLKDMKISRSLYKKYTNDEYIVTIKIPSNSDHLQELVDLQHKTENDRSFIKIKYRSGEPHDKDYPVKSVVNLSGKGLTKDEINYLIETFETTDGIKLTSKSLRNRLNNQWPISTTVYAKSPDCFNHFVFMLKPYNIKFVRTEVFE
jgi:hypothetical protein